VQPLLGRAGGSADAGRDDLRAYVIEPCGEPQAVRGGDDTGVLKQGRTSGGVARQSSGTAGRVGNCHIGGLFVSATAQGRTFLERELSLPQEWAAEETRRHAAGVPTEVRCATTPQRAQRRLRRALAAGRPCGGRTGDTVDGHDGRVRAWLEEHRINDVLGVSAQSRLLTGQERDWAAPVVRGRPDAAWHRCRGGAGSPGERLYDWARLPLRAIDGQRQRWLLARRSLRAPTELADDVASGPPQTPLDELARVAGTRWAGEERVETATGGRRMGSLCSAPRAGAGGANQAAFPAGADIRRHGADRGGDSGIHRGDWPQPHIRRSLWQPGRSLHDATEV
jgi:DDE superfamily endonuclease